MGAKGSTGPEAVAAAEKNASLLITRAGAGDPSAPPSICRISAALQYDAGNFYDLICAQHGGGTFHGHHN